MRRGSARGVPRNWKRGFEWDAAFAGGGFSSAGDQECFWLRIPSDNPDPLNFRSIHAKTLVKTLMSIYYQLGELSGASFATLYVGIIAWDGNVTTPVLADQPDVSNGAFDWIGWWAFEAARIGGAATSGYFEYGSGFADKTGWLELSSQRKLPPGRGILGCISVVTNSLVPVVAQVSMDVRMGLKGEVTAVGLGST